MSVVESFVPVYHRSDFHCEVDEKIAENDFFLLSLKRTEVINPSLPNVVFLHGWFGSSEDYKYAFDHYSNHFNMFAIDLRGHGDSDSPLDLSWSIQDLATDIHCALSQFLGSDFKINLVASSLSSAVSLTFTKLFPEHVDSLVLISPTIKFSVPLWLKGLTKLSPKKLIRAVAKLFEKTLPYFASEEEIPTYKKFISQLTNAPLEIQKKIIEETIASYCIDPSVIDTPTLIFAGTDDKVIPFEDSVKLDALLPNSTLIALEGMPHRILNKEPRLIITFSLFFIENPMHFLTKNKQSPDQNYHNA